MPRILKAGLLVGALVLAATAGCSAERSEQSAPEVAPAVEGASRTTGPVADATIPSTTTTPPASTMAARRPVTAPAAAVAASGTCPAIPARAAPRPDRSQYRLRVDVRPAENLVRGEVAVRFTPDLATDRLVFRLWPNGPRTGGAGARLEVSDVKVGGVPVGSARPDATTLEVPVPGGLRPGQAVEASMSWELALPGPVADRVSRSGDAIRLGSFFPILPWEPGVGWAREPAVSGFAEASIAIAADFDVTVAVPDGLQVLATGVEGPAGHWRADAVPDFALSVGRFRLAEATVPAPQPVVVRVGVHEGVTGDPAAYLARVSSALRSLAERYGPYPWPAYTLAITPALKGGIEYPGHVMQGPNSTGRSTPHEVAHQWFYALVGSNQGRDPWLDEGVASFAEAQVEGTLASFRARSIPAEARGRTAEPMTFWEPRQPSYYRGVYVQGAQALAALGPPALVDCVLRLYVARTAFDVARPADLVAAATAVFPDAAATLARYGIRP